MIHKAAVAAKKFGPKSSKKFGKGLPGGTNCKESTCRCKRLGFDPWVGKIPSIHVWKIPWTKGPGRLQSLGSLSLTQLSMHARGWKL